MTDATENPPRPSGHGKYRPDIDGLRAVAVLSVVGYHALPRVVPGGFVGVDVFFVISGYLITSIIVGDLARGRFTYRDFYARRIRRIFPALALVLVAVWIAGWLRLFPDEYRQLGKHVAAGAAFVSNFVLRGDAGYFDTAAETKPLLHLWSLGIEEQFYIFWPLILAWTTRRFASIWTIVAIAAVSFAFDIGTIGTEPQAAFYSPLSRFWELMVGGMLAQAVRARPAAFERFRDVRGAAGLALVAIAVTAFAKGVPYPGWRALLPTVGAFLVISAGPHAWVNRLVLSNPVAVWFGRISYPLYLWHWPLLSFLYIDEGEATRASTRVLLVVVSVILAWLTWRFVEKPIQRTASFRTLPVALFGTIAVIGGVGFATWNAGGFASRFDERGAWSASFDESLPDMPYRTRHGINAAFREECNFYDFDAWRHGRSTNRPRDAIDPSCVARPAGTSTAVFLWGDSHAQHLNWGLRAYLPPQTALLQVATSGCNAALPGADDSTPAFCRASNAFAWSTILHDPPDVVVIAQRADHDMQRFRTIAKALHDAGVHEVVVLGPVPQWSPDLHRVIASRYWDRTPDHLSDALDVVAVRASERMAAQWRADDPFVFVDLRRALCDERGCLTMIDGDRRDGLITFDYGHFTKPASAFVARTIVGPVVSRALASTTMTR